jgi:hypothetical protein
MSKLYNLARMTTATTGTGTITLGSAVSGFLSFSGAGVSNAETVTYAIEDGSNREIGTGTYTSSGTTLSRSVTKSTNSDSAISLSGSAQVFITPRTEDIGNKTETNTWTSAQTFSSSVKSTSASAGVGYGTGAGSTQTQASSITTAVSINALCGTITTVSTTLAGAAEASFTVNNTSVASTDGVFVWIKSTSSAGEPVVFVTAVGSSSFEITLANLGAAALDNTVTIGFMVLKGVTA